MGPLFAGLVISCVVAFLLPNTYVSTAVMRIPPAQISEALVPSTVSQQMNERIAQMQQEILSRTSLSELIQKPALNLTGASGIRTLEDVIEKMRTQDIRINIDQLGWAGKPSGVRVQHLVRLSGPVQSASGGAGADDQIHRIDGESCRAIRVR